MILGDIEDCGFKNLEALQKSQVMGQYTGQLCAEVPTDLACFRFLYLSLLNSVRIS